MICPYNRKWCPWPLGCSVPCTSDDTRLVIEQDGVEYKGPTFAERRAAHDHGECDAMCGICYDEACQPPSQEPSE